MLKKLLLVALLIFVVDSKFYLVETQNSARLKGSSRGRGSGSRFSDYQNNEIKIKLKANETKIIEEVAVEVQAAQSCRPPPDYKEKKRQGFCWDGKNCAFLIPGINPGSDTCSQRICVNGRVMENDKACEYCTILEENSVKLISGEGWQSCGNSCDQCSCHKVEGKQARLERERDGCKLPKRCPGFCPSDTEIHRVGDKWDCWLDDWSCFGSCACNETPEGRARTSVSMSTQSGCLAERQTNVCGG